ncbi:unnamed protein product [Thelazia callipaeda]|uniref:LSDAT_euk domain-containing protein n=1 Tax=Thelazia callipaeda TaxID=103827 RepID=A0A0N5CXY6_THECL|nr:unnamed protein product [Thelazia callipaeda]
MESGEEASRDDKLLVTNVKLCVEATCSDGSGLIEQTCPALLLTSQKAIPKVVKHIYSHLAAYSRHIDEGVPDLIISLISGENLIELQKQKQIENALLQIIANCNSWLVISGEAGDPLSRAAANAVHAMQLSNENSMETLLLAVNDTKCIINDQQTYRIPMINTKFNTLMILSMQELLSAKSLALFKALITVKLSTPPPALLIGIPQSISNNRTASQTVLLPPSEQENLPVPVALFSGSDLSSLAELRAHLQCGISVIVLQDGSELCAILNISWLLYRSSSFHFESWLDWLDSELRSLQPNSLLHGNELLEEAKENIITSFAVGCAEIPLLSFILFEQVLCLPEHLLKLCMQNAIDANDIHRLLQIAIKLNVPTIISSTDLNKLNTNMNLIDLFEEALLTDQQLITLAAILEQNISWKVSLNLLTKLMRCAPDQIFFNTVITCDCLGRKSPVLEIDSNFIEEMDEFLVSLSGGFEYLLPISYFQHFLTNTNQTLQILAIWSVMLNRLELAKCLCAYSTHPLSLAIILAKICRALADKLNDRLLYKDDLYTVAQWFSDHAEGILDLAYTESPRSTYQSLCIPLDFLNGLTLAELALQTSNKKFIAHRCCQKWIRRLLYGKLQVIYSKTSIFLPNWLKILLASVLIFPIYWWMKYCVPERYSLDQNSNLSPTAALLQFHGQESMKRKYSARSFMSNKSIASAVVRDERSLGETSTSSCLLVEGQQSAEGIVLEEIDATALVSRSKERRQTPRHTGISIGIFYSTPIVKYWLSLVFRLLHIALFAYAISLPGCGSFIMDALIWLWTFLSLLESVWVFSNRIQRTLLYQLRWYFINIIVITLHLLIILVLKIVSLTVSVSSMPFSIHFVIRIWSAFLFIYLCYSKLVETEHCKKSYIGDYQNRNQCVAVGGFTDYNCPSRNWISYIAILEYLIILKLICWPIIIALFAKTAKEVDEEVDKIWKYQLYSLTEDLRFRPPLPPPFTPIFFFGALCCRSNRYLISSWENLYTCVPYDQTNIQKLMIEEKYRPHNILISYYCPPFYCKPIEEFASDIQKYADASTPENLSLLRRYWRRWQQNKMLDLFDILLPRIVDSSGLPLNPNGRQGIAGRGNHLKFGVNLLSILLEGNTFPSRWRFSAARCDEDFQALLRSLLLTDSEIRQFCNQSSLNIGETNNDVAHVKRVSVVDSRDTDNAWVEHDIWAFRLRSQIPDPLSILPRTYNWHNGSCAEEILSDRDREYLSAAVACFCSSHND